jgi:hypothetical protein
LFLGFDLRCFVNFSARLVRPQVRGGNQKTGK